jgi:Bacterial Ig-like domain
MTGHDDDYPPVERDYTDDPPLRETAGLVHGVLHTDRMRPAFRDQLRSRLVAERAEVIRRGEVGRAAAPGPVPPAPPGHRPPARPLPPAGPAQRPAAQRPGPPRPAADRPAADRPGARPHARRRRLRPAVVGWGVAAIAAAAVGFLVLGLPTLRAGGGPATVAIRSDISGTVSWDPAAAVRITFDRPVAHAATQTAVQLAPYADTTPSWDGNTLVLTPTNGFAPNTGYLVTINHTVARTAGGNQLAADLHLAFGTAPRPGEGPAPATPLELHPNAVAGAQDGSEAVITRDGSLLLTKATAGPATGNRSGLVRIGDHGTERLSGAADAICVSRSGDSIAYLADTGSDTQVVFANSAGSPQGHRAVQIDTDSPLGWINDDRVSYVSQGRLVAIDRDGHRVDLGVAVNPAHDGFAIAPGGGYVYVEGRGVIPIRDLHAGRAYPLRGISGQPAFSGDGATVAWFDTSSGTPQLSVAPSAGGPVFTTRLPDVARGDQLSDLSISPDGSHIVYSVSRGDRSELRLASLPDGDTLAVSTGGAGESPNWSPSGRTFTVLRRAGQGARIDTVSVPQPLRDRGAALEALAETFASAQVGGDREAQQALAASGASLPRLAAAPTRATVLWVIQNADGTARARIRLSTDPTAADPRATQVDEVLTLGTPDGAVRPRVLKASAGRPQAAPAGPQLVHLDTDARPGAVVLTFDSDLDPASLPAITLVTSDGGPVPAKVAASGARAVTVTPDSHIDKARVVVGTGLRDAAGRPLAGQSRIDQAVTLDQH